LDIQVKSDSGLIELLASLNSSQPEKGGYVTVTEMSETLGVSTRKVHAMLRILIAEGKVEHGHIPMRSIDNRMVRSNGYRLVAN
jgi:Mn-dependent DtxR family transcriptional regulator